MAEATVVSFLPYPFKDTKPGMYPAEFFIPRANGKEFQVLVVGDGRRGIYLDHDRGSELVLVPAKTVARSLVEDYVISQPLQDAEIGPGITWFDGGFTKEALVVKFKTKLDHVWEAQRVWFTRLVKEADDLWVANHKFSQIGDLERNACRELGLKRDWLTDDPNLIMKCPVCTTLVSSEAIVCFACHVVLDARRLKDFQFLGTQPQLPVQTPNAK